MGFRFVNYGVKFKHSVTAMYQKLGIDCTADQMAVLVVLIYYNGISQSELCERCYKNNSNLTRILKVMDARGIINREKGRDARSRIVNITDKGRELYESVIHATRQYIEELFSDFSDEDRQVLDSLLEKINKKITL